MRIPLAVSLESRDGTVSKDARVLNGIVEVKGAPPNQQMEVRRRPGNSDLGLVKAGVAQLLYAWNGVRAVLADYLNSGTPSGIVSAPLQTNLTPTNASLPFQAQDTGFNAATPYLMIKNRTQAWTVNRAGTVAAITYGGTMGSATVAVISITRSGTVATVTTGTDLGVNVGDTATIAGAVEGAYNGAQTVTAVTLGSYTPSRDIPITITRVGTLATATTVSGVHGLSTSTRTISGANQTEYNGAKAITVTSTTQFTFTVTVTPDTTRTWNAADKDTTITLSGGSLVATCAAVFPAFGGVRATAGKSTGKFYWEVTLTAFAQATVYSQIGIGTSGVALTDRIGNSANGWAWTSGGDTRHAGVGLTYGSAWAQGDVIGVALDTDSGTLTFYKNGVSQGQAYSGITGTIFPMVGGSNVGTSPAFTANFGATAFAYSIPSGYVAFQSDAPITPGTGTITINDPAVTVNPTFTYTVGGSPTTPATGTITAAIVGGTVPGIAYINGYFCVMDVNGVVWNSASDNPTSWPALNFVLAQTENGGGKAMAKSLNYLIAFKEWSTEFFYDAKLSPGSPFSPVDNGFTQVGCATGFSLSTIDGNLMWMSQVRQRGRSIHLMQGLQQQKVSTPDVERILNADDLATVHAYAMKLDGHSLYVLTLVTSNITLVYDLTAQQWLQWTSLTLGSAKAISSITRSGTTATVNFAVPHTLSDGDPIKIAGAGQTQYNGIFPALVTDALTATIEVSGSPATPASSVSYATLNPADKGSNVTLSGGNLSASMVNTNTMVRGTVSVAVGKWYWEVTVTGSGGAVYAPTVGVAKSTATLNNYLGQDANGWSYYGKTGEKVNNGALVAYGSTFTTGDVIGVALNADTGIVTFYKNGVSQGSAFTGLSGTFYPAVSGDATANTVTVTCNFGATAFAYSVPSGYNSGIYTSGISGTPYTESYFKFTKYVDYQGLNLLLHESDGHLYQISSSLYQDSGIPINVASRSTRLDGGTDDWKKLAAITVIGDKVVGGLSLIRWSDDDYVTNSAYRIVNLGLDQSRLRRCGSFRRRSVELRDVGNYPLRLEALEMEIGQ